MNIEVDEALVERMREFSRKYCRGKEPRFNMLLDMCKALGLRLRVKSIEDGTE